MATLELRRGAARDGVSLQSSSPERSYITGWMYLHPRGQSEAARAGMPHTGTNASGERLLPIPRAPTYRSIAPKKNATSAVIPVSTSRLQLGMPLPDRRSAACRSALCDTCSQHALGLGG